jgi:hypothetical protein
VKASTFFKTVVKNQKCTNLYHRPMVSNKHPR